MDEDSSGAGDDEGDGDINQSIASNDGMTMEEYELHRTHKKFVLRQLPSRGLSFQVWPAASALCWFLDEFFWHHQDIVTCIRQEQRVPTSFKLEKVDVTMAGSGLRSGAGQELREKTWIEQGEREVRMNLIEVNSKVGQNGRILVGIGQEENDVPINGNGKISVGESSRIATFSRRKQVDVPMNGSERSSEISQNPRMSTCIEHDKNDTPLNKSKVILKSGQDPRMPTCIELEENDAGEGPRTPTSIELENDDVSTYDCEPRLELGQSPRTPPYIQQYKDVNGSKLSSEAGHIASHLLARRGERKALRVLELGAGTGMVGIAVALMGAEVIITDLPHVLPNLEFNVSANKDAIGATELGGNVCVRALRWGSEEDALEVRSNFDLVLASDVVYNENLFDSLILTMKWLLLSKSEEGGNPIMLMAHLRRWKKDARFFKKAKKLFDVRVVHRHPTQPASRLGVIVYCFTKKK